MSSPTPTNLLRRTLAVTATITATLFAGEVSAQSAGTVTLNGVTGNTCTYSSLSVTPSGAVSVTCSGGSTPPPPPPSGPGKFAFASAAMAAPPNTTVNPAITRTEGSDGSFTLYFWYTGSACAWSSAGAVSFGNGETSKTIPAPVLAAGTCTVHLAAPAAPAELGAITTTTITVDPNSAPPPPPPPPTGCPTGFTPPDNMINATFAGPGNPFKPMVLAASGQVISIPLPKNLARASGIFQLFESTAMPTSATIEISINKCPGLIDTNLNSYCNMRTDNMNFNQITWFGKAYSSVVDAASANAARFCWAGDSEQYYVNTRSSYTSCSWGTCGFNMQYREGGY